MEESEQASPAPMPESQKRALHAGYCKILQESREGLQEFAADDPIFAEELTDLMQEPDFAAFSDILDGLPPENIAAMGEIVFGMENALLAKIRDVFLRDL